MVFPVLIITLTRHGMACKHGISISPILTYQVCFHPLLLCFEMLHPVPWPSVSRKFQLASNGYTDKTPSTSSQTYQQLILSIAFHPSEVSRSSFNTKAETFGYPPPFFSFFFLFLLITNILVKAGIRQNAITVSRTHKARPSQSMR